MATGWLEQLQRVILGFAQGILAPLIAYAAIFILIMLPVWCWGWLADPTNLSRISILQIILIVVAVGIIFWSLTVWIVALTVLPATLIHVIAPPCKWIRVGTAGLLVCWMVATQALVIIAYNIGCIRISDGLTSKRCPAPDWLYNLHGRFPSHQPKHPATGKRPSRNPNRKATA